ncbi:uncharacterized protein LOC103497731 [Cucumis melo]|uniref:Uncharacterized protein LOC103497731 n=2 Tax=Cucumis melo TaxID=3656 RepID=A0A1S3C6Z7_CUCME|nr:uncharacterized protein LOC103497731 [Cucumis melo]
MRNLHPPNNTSTLITSPSPPPPPHPIGMSMFTIHIERGNALRRLLLPIANLSNTAQINCSIPCLSFVVSPRNNFIVVLRIFPAFFTSYQFNPNYAGNYTSFHAKLYLRLLHTNISNMFTDELSVTIYLNRFESTIPVRFYEPRSGYLQFSALLLARARRIPMYPVDMGVFFAIRSDEFLKILTDLRVLSGEYFVIYVSTTKALFKSLRREIAYNTRDDENMMVMGGVPTGGARQFFLICPSPLHFFYYTASISKMVWFFIAAENHTRHFLSCCVNIHASYLVCF